MITWMITRRDVMKERSYFELDWGNMVAVYEITISVLFLCLQLIGQIAPLKKNFQYFNSSYILII